MEQNFDGNGKAFTMIYSHRKKQNTVYMNTIDMAIRQTADD